MVDLGGAMINRCALVDTPSKSELSASCEVGADVPHLQVAYACHLFLIG
jgi:hypothetical protein